MLAGIGSLARSFGLALSRLALVLALAAGAPAAADADPGDSEVIDAAVGGIAVRLAAPTGQMPAASPLQPIYLLHDVSGDDLQALAVYLSPETERFFATRGQALPASGLMSTLIVTERALESRYLDARAMRDLLVDELAEKRRVQGFLASERFGSEGLRIALPETRLLQVEDFLIIEGNERLLPESGRRISYCVEAFVALRNRPVLAGSCLTKPEVAAADMYALDSAVGAWAQRLLADNPSSRSPARSDSEGANRPAAQSRSDPTAQRLLVANLRAAARHRRADVLVASALLSAQLPADLRSEFQSSNERFGRNVADMCAQGRDPALDQQCQLIAFDRRLRALERCSPESIAPVLAAEAVEPVSGQLPST